MSADFNSQGLNLLKLQEQELSIQAATTLFRISSNLLRLFKILIYLILVTIFKDTVQKELDIKNISDYFILNQNFHLNKISHILLL